MLKKSWKWERNVFFASLWGMQGKENTFARSNISCLNGTDVIKKISTLSHLEFPIWVHLTMQHLETAVAFTKPIFKVFFGRMPHAIGPSAWIEIEVALRFVSVSSVSHGTMQTLRKSNPAIPSCSYDIACSEHLSKWSIQVIYWSARFGFRISERLAIHPHNLGAIYTGQLSCVLKRQNDLTWQKGICARTLGSRVHKNPFFWSNRPCTRTSKSHLHTSDFARMFGSHVHTIGLPFSNCGLSGLDRMQKHFFGGWGGVGGSGWSSMGTHSRTRTERNRSIFCS